jgi:hypothetical protein
MHLKLYILIAEGITKPHTKEVVLTGFQKSNRIFPSTSEPALHFPCTVGPVSPHYDSFNLLMVKMALWYGKHI